MAFDAAMDMAQRSQRADDPAPDGADAGADSRDGSPSAAEHESGNGSAGEAVDGSGNGAAEATPASSASGSARAAPGRRRQPPPQHLALLRLDVSALWRGYVEGDELCEVAGLGPIPVEAARRLLGDAVIKLIITKGNAVAHATSLTRGPTQAMRYALLWSSPTCTVEGCTPTIHRTEEHQ